MNEDLTLLREYAWSHSEDAFATLVSHYVNLVYSVALRQVGDPHMAEEITQAVFVVLARKAGSLSDKTILPGWLCRTARYAAANALTIQRRRQHREQEAYMQTQLDVATVSPDSGPVADTWACIAPLLDTAMETLKRKDHDALVLRFFENRSFAEVGAALGASEDAAKMRVNRALEKLRRHFNKNGASFSAVMITGAISRHSIQTAPAELTGTASLVAAAQGAGGSVAVAGIADGVSKVLAWSRAKATLATWALALAVVAAGTGAIVYALGSSNRFGSSPVTGQAGTPQVNGLTQAEIDRQENLIRANLNTGPDLPPDETEARQQKLQDQYAVLRDQEYALRAQRAAQSALSPSTSVRYEELSLKLSPFTTGRFEGDKVGVVYNGAEYELQAINDLSTADIIDFCRRQYGRLWDIRFADDLVDVLKDMNHPVPPERACTVTLVDPKTGQSTTVERVPLTKVNRKDIVEALYPEPGGWTPWDLYTHNHR